MAETIIDGTNIDTSLFAYSAPKAHEAGGKVVNLWNKKFKSSLTLSTPLILTWGAQESLDVNKNPLGKYTLSLQFPSPDYSTPDLEAFLNSMKKLEEKVKDDALTYSKEWFGKQHKSRDIIDALFNPMLRYPKIKGSEEVDSSKSPTLTVKLPCWNGVWKSEIYDEDAEPLFPNKNSPLTTPIEFLKKGAHIACVIQCGGIWFVNGKFSVTWNLKQAVVKKPKDTIEGTCFIKLKAADKEKLKTTEVPDENEIPVTSAEISSTLVDDSDDEGELEEVVVKKPEPEPVKEEPVEKPKKKVVKKKTDA